MEVSYRLRLWIYALWESVDTPEDLQALKKIQCTMPLLFNNVIINISLFL